MNPLTTSVALNDVLTACLAAFTDQETANAPPERVFISHGQPVAWGEQLVVWSPGIRSVKPMPLTRLSAIKATVIPALDITIDLWRAGWPLAEIGALSKSFPDPAKVTAAALSLANDAAALFGHVAGLAAAGTLFPSLPTIGTADDVAFSPLVALPPQGPLAGWRWPLTLKLAIP